MTLFVSRLNEARELGGVSWSELARLCGAPRSYFAQVDRLKTDAVLSRAAAAAVVLGASLDYLALGRGAPPTEDAAREAVSRARRDPERTQRSIAAALGITRAPRPRASKRTAAAAATHRPRRAKPLPRIAPAPEARS